MSDKARPRRISSKAAFSILSDAESSGADSEPDSVALREPCPVRLELASGTNRHSDASEPSQLTLPEHGLSSAGDGTPDAENPKGRESVPVAGEVPMPSVFTLRTRAEDRSVPLISTAAGGMSLSGKAMFLRDTSSVPLGCDGVPDRAMAALSRPSGTGTSVNSRAILMATSRNRASRASLRPSRLPKAVSVPCGSTDRSRLSTDSPLPKAMLTGRFKRTPTSVRFRLSVNVRRSTCAFCPAMSSANPMSADVLPWRATDA